jgi:hypothetical protein
MRRVLLASFFFNAFSFLFTMRPLKALLTLLGFTVFAISGNYLLDNDKIPDILEVAGAALFILSPMLINAFLLIKHERELDNSSSRAQGLRT